MFSGFQTERDPAKEGLHATGHTAPFHTIRPYEAALYLQFLQQEAGSRQPVVDLWTTSQAARTKEAFDKHLDTIVPFAEHFREFAVSDLNKQLAGTPLPSLFSDLDDARPAGVEPRVLLPSPLLLPSRKYDRWVNLAPLFAQFELYQVDPDARHVRVDTSDVPNTEHLQIDAIVKIGSSWERRRVEGPIFEFCRDDEGDDISFFYLVLSNDDRMREGEIDGSYKVETKAACPGGWSGYIRTVFTLDESSYETQPAGTTAYERHEREEQRWTVVETNLVTTPYQPEFEQLTMAWHVISSVDIWQTFTSQCMGYYPARTGVLTDTEVANSGFSETSIFAAFPASAGTFSLQPVAVGHSFDMPVTYTDDDQCEATFQTSQGTKLVTEGIAYLYSNIPDFTPLVPLPNDPGHFTGSATVLHNEQPRPGGAQVMDLSVNWDLRRTLDR